MPYKSDVQRKFFHTDTAKTQGITPETVKEFDTASKGMKLPKRVKKSSQKKAKSVMQAVSKKIQPRGY